MCQKIAFFSKIYLKTRGNNAVASATVRDVDKVSNKATKDLHKRCLTELTKVVRALADALSVSGNSIMNSTALKIMSEELPSNEKDMMNIPHVTKANFDKYGKVLLDITKKYAAENHRK